MVIQPADVLRWHERYGWTDDCIGEWDELQREVRRPLRVALDSGRTLAVSTLLDSMFRNELHYGLVSLPEQLDKLDRVMAWRVGQWASVSGTRRWDVLRAPGVCNPVVINLEGIYIMPDAPRFDRYAQVIARYLVPGDTVAEIGAGYGGVAVQLDRRVPGLRVVLVDLPETLYLAGWYLSRALPHRSVAWWDEDPAADVRLLPIQDRDACDVRPRLVCAFHTFSGLDAAVSAEWMAWIDQSAARWLYHDDVLHHPHIEGAWMTERYPEVCVHELPRPADYDELWRERIPWTGFADRFVELFWERWR